MEKKETRGRDGKAETETTERRRKRGNKGGLSTKLAITDKIRDNNAGYDLRWINDDAIRLYEVTNEDDWDFVASDGKLSPSADGALTRYVGMKDGKPMNAYLMRKPKAYRAEDKANEQEALDEKMKQISRNAEGAEALVGRAYTPREGVSLK